MKSRINIIVFGIVLSFASLSYVVHAQTSDQAIRSNDPSIWQNIPGNINQTTGNRTPLYDPNIPSGEADARTNSPVTSEGLPKSATAPAPTPPPGLTPTRTALQQPLTSRRRSMIKGQREIRDPAPSTQNVEANLQSYFANDPEALVRCGGNLVRLASVRVAGVHPYEPVYPADQSGEVWYLRATIYFRGVVPTTEPYCPGETIETDIDAVHLLSDAEGTNNLGGWYIPIWHRSISARR